jgi:hypothetical protein
MSGDKRARSNDSAVGARPVKGPALSMLGKPGSICRHILASRKEYVEDVFRVNRGFFINGGLGMQILLCPVTLQFLVHTATRSFAQNLSGLIVYWRQFRFCDLSGNSQPL